MTELQSSRLTRLLRRLFSWTIAAVFGGLLYKALQKWAEYRKRIGDSSSHELVVEHSYLRKDWEKVPAEPQKPPEKREPVEPADITQFGLPDDPFELSTKLDAGGQGTVFRCIRQNTQHEYAVKVINTTFVEKSERQLASLRKEIRIMRELHHPHIVNLHEAFWTDDQCLIVMDLAHGGNLFDTLHKDIMDCHCDPFPGLGGKEFASKYVAGQLLEGIGYMHAHHVLHRDLKLENILITHSSFSAEEDCTLHHIKIADFGLSTSREKSTSKAKLKRTMTAVGTPDYVAPEVLKGKYDERVDYWSFGVILYAMLCGRMPFVVRCLSPEEHREQVSQVSDCSSWRLISREGRHLVQGLLTVDPEMRLGLLQCSEHPWLMGAVASTCVFLPPESPTKIARVDSTGGVVDSIIGRTGEGVHGLELWQRDGKVHRHGSDGGATQIIFQVEPDELLVAVMQDFSLEKLLGSSLVFYTSKARILAISGSEARTRRRFVAPQGRQISGMQFDNHQLMGVFLEKVEDHRGAVECITGRVGSAVDSCELKLRDGTTYSYGESGGDMIRGPWQLLEDEWIIVVEQFFRDRKLGASLVFYTSSGRVLKLSGMTAVRSPRFAAPWGQQICDLRFDVSGRLVQVVTANLSGASPAKACTIQMTEK